MLLGTCLIFVFLVILIVIGLFWWLSYWVLFYPSREIIWEPNPSQTPYQDLYLPVAENKWGKCYRKDEPRPVPCVNVWYFDQLNTISRRGHCAATVLYFHGNSGNISHREYVVDICQRFGLTLLLVDYQGYGRSDGQVNPDSIYQVGEAAYHFLTGKVNSRDIIIWGGSLGGTAACYVSS